MKTEYPVYGYSSLIADFGGYLGLLVGHSLLSLFDLAVQTLSSVKKAL